MKWEYHNVKMDRLPAGMIEIFDALGNQGWELVGFYQDTAYFKRPIDTAPKKRQSLSIQGLPEFIHSVCVTSDAIFAGSGSGFIYKSDDRGRSWNTVHAGTFTQYPIKKIFTERRDTILAYSGSDVLIGSRDNGLTWEYFEENDK